MLAAEPPPELAVVCDTVPYPNRSGDNRRIAELIAVLRRQGWFVHLILCGFADGPQRKVCRAHVDALHVYAGTGWKRRARNGLRRTVRYCDRLGKSIGLPPAEEVAARLLGRSITPVVMDYWQRYPAGLDDFVAGLAARRRLRALIVEYLWLHEAAAKINQGTLRLLDTHDLQHRRVEEFASRGLTFPLQVTRDQEAAIFNRFDSVIAIQSREAALIRSMCPQLRVLTVGCSGTPAGSTGDRPVAGRVLYVGGYNGANIDGLRRFLERVWQRVQTLYPHAHLRVCGYICRAFTGTTFTKVEFVGHMEDTEDEYAQASVVINPSWIGTGLKIKSVEALTRGKALVTTAMGVEGLPDDVLQAAQVFDDEAAFAGAIARLLTDPTARERAAKAARDFATVHLSHRAVYQELLDFLTEAR